MTASKKDILFFVRIIGVLLVITMCVAALLALVNEITKDKIAENEAAMLENAVKKLFPDAQSPKTEKVSVKLKDSTFKGLYELKDNGTIVGYYAEVTPKGFKGEVAMLVGITVSGDVCGIEILSTSETPGIGDKIEKKSYLDKIAKGEYDTISGATYSSKAVINGTKTALKAYKTMTDGEGA